MRRSLGVILLGTLVACGGSDGGGNSPNAPSTPAPTATPAPTPTPAPAVNVTGVWTSEARAWCFELTQTGSTITGRVAGYKNCREQYPPDPVFAITGSVTSGNRVRFQSPAFAIGFDGTVQSNGRQMNGTLEDCAGVCRSYGEVLLKN